MPGINDIVLMMNMDQCYLASVCANRFQISTIHGQVPIEYPFEYVRLWEKSCYERLRAVNVSYMHAPLAHKSGKARMLSINIVVTRQIHLAEEFKVQSP